MDETLRQLGELLLGSIPTIVLFGIVWIAYRAIVHGALKRALAQRHSQTVGAAEKAKADVAIAERKTAEYEGKLREARHAIYKSQEARRQQVLDRKTIAIAQSKEAAETLVMNARAEIQRDTEAAKTRVQAESSNLAREIIRAILRSGAAAKQPVGGR